MNRNSLYYGGLRMSLVIGKAGRKNIYTINWSVSGKAEKYAGTEDEICISIEAVRNEAIKDDADCEEDEFEVLENEIDFEEEERIAD